VWAADVAGNDTVGHWYIAPQIGGTITDHARSVDDAVFYGLAVGKHLNEDWSAELNILSGRYDGRHGAPDLRISTASADILRVFNRNGTVSPFLTAGLGVLHDQASPGTSHNNFMADAGAGALIHIWENASGSSNFSFRPEIKARWADESAYNHPVDVLIGLGFEFAFGPPHAAPTVAAPAPAATPPAPPPPPVATYKPTVIDSDGDGVPDDRDQCPNTPHGTAVDAVGCPLTGSITLAGVHFDNNSARLTPESSAVLDPLATSLRAHPRLRLQVQGHTDAVGSAPYNLKLSQARAAAVEEYLVARGVPSAELTAKGFGKTQPIADNNTATGRAQNRRVVMVVLDNPGDVQIKQDGAP
jgi:OOP family OmpA-OmpF porin